MLAALRDLARETGAWLLLGSLVSTSREPGAEGERRLANRSFLIAPDGAHRRALRQDPHVRRRSAGGESYREINAFRPGEARGAGRDCPGACSA